jgi:hypothetical protein
LKAAVDELTSGSGVQRVEYSIDRGRWKTGSSLTVKAPAMHSGDGIHIIAYRANVTIRLRRPGGPVPRTLDLGWRHTNRWLSFRLKCSLAPGSYRYHVGAVDLAGNHQRRGLNTLTVAP